MGWDRSQGRTKRQPTKGRSPRILPQPSTATAHPQPEAASAAASCPSGGWQRTGTRKLPAGRVPVTLARRESVWAERGVRPWNRMKEPPNDQLEVISPLLSIVHVPS